MVWNLKFVLAIFNYLNPNLQRVKGEFKDGAVITEKSQRLMKRNFGKVDDEHLILTPEEAAYLVSKGVLEVYDEKKVMGFDDILFHADPVRYFVFEDLRERGKRVNIRELDNKYIPIHESFMLRISKLKKVEGKKVAVVDSEGEVSYFLVNSFDERGEHEEEIKPFDAKFSNGFFVTGYTELHRKYFYGTERGGRVLLSIYEGLYLIEKETMNVKESFNTIYRAGQEMFPSFDRIYNIYRDLRERGFMVKTGLKFGSEFRVYIKIRSLKELEHSKYLVKLKSEVCARELAGDVRLCTAVRKTLLYPVFEKNGDVSYISVKRVKF